MNVKAQPMGIGGETRLQPLSKAQLKGFKRSSKLMLRLKLYVALLLIDSISVFTGFAIANSLRFGEAIHERGIMVLVAVMPVYLGIALINRAYNIDVITHGRDGITRTVTSLLCAVLSIIFITFCLRASVEFSRLIVGLGTFFSIIFLVILRGGFERLLSRTNREALFSELFIKDGVDIGDVGELHVLDTRDLQLRPDVSDPIMLDRLGQYLKNADRVIVACAPERRIAWSTALKGANVDGEILAHEFDYLGVIGTGRFDNQMTIRVSSGPLGLRERAIKRFLDLAVSISMIILLAPLMLLVAAAIKLESPGPILFKQQRLGRGNRLFNVFKFRSMRIETCDHSGDRSTTRDDDRITRIGRLIRKTSIDELPQLFNVLLSDMSMVGPRPHALGSTAGDELFWEIDSRYWHRHAAKPGVTGLAQVRGYRGATIGRSDLVNRLQADLEYLNGWNVWRDISIMLATFRVIIHRNAF